MIKSKDVSVVIQGVVNKGTRKVLKSVRKYLSCAEVILSTWEGSDIEGLSGLYDILVLNKDPGGVVFDDKENKQNNLNRIIVSSKNGVDRATRTYVLRLRSDMQLQNANVLKLFDNFAIRNEEAKLFRNRIFAYDIFSIKYDIRENVPQRMLFHISDWCYFGLKEDIKELFNVPPVDEPEFSRYFETRKKLSNDVHKDRLWKMSPEQYIVSENAKKVFKNFNFENYLDINEENIKISENFIINNFRVFSQEEWGIVTQKKLYKNIKMFFNPYYIYYSKEEQLKDYNKYCDSTATIKKIKFLDYFYKIKNFLPLRKHFLKLIFCPLYKKPSEFISTVSYSIKFLFSILGDLLCKKK